METKAKEGMSEVRERDKVAGFRVRKIRGRFLRRTLVWKECHRRWWFFPP